MSKAAATKVMGLVNISSLNSGGDVIDTWVLHNAWMKNVTMGEYDYSDDSLISMDVELRYDFATFTSVAAPPGTTDINAGAAKLADTGLA